MRRVLTSSEKEKRYGKLLGTYDGNELRKLKNKQFNECDITKEAKLIMKGKHNLVEEVAVWNNKGQLRAVFDLYDIKKKWGIELIWSSGRTMRKLTKKITKYKIYCRKLTCIFLKDSTRKRTNRYYTEWKKNRIRELGVNVSVMDVRAPSVSSFLMEHEN